MQRMALSFSRITSTFESNLTLVHAYIKELQENGKNPQEQGKRSNGQSFVTSSNGDLKAPKLESLANLVSNLNCELHERMDLVD